AHWHVLRRRHRSGWLCDLRREEKRIRMFSAFATPAACHAISEEKRSSFACSRHAPRQRLAMRSRKRREAHSHVLGIRHASRLPCELRREEKFIRMFSACATAAACYAISEEKRSSFACSRHSRHQQPKSHWLMTLLQLASRSTAYFTVLRSYHRGRR